MTWSWSITQPPIHTHLWLCWLALSDPRIVLPTGLNGMYSRIQDGLNIFILSLKLQPRAMIDLTSYLEQWSSVTYTFLMLVYENFIVILKRIG